MILIMDLRHHNNHKAIQKKLEDTEQTVVFTLFYILMYTLKRLFGIFISGV